MSAFTISGHSTLPVVKPSLIAIACAMHIITGENFQEASAACRDILMIYFDLAWSCEGFSHSCGYPVRFDPLKFIDAKMQIGGLDLELLHEGSAIAILCFFYDLWCEEQVLSGPLSERYEEALQAGRLSAFLDIESVLREAISRDYIAIEDPWFEDAVVPIYRKYVRGLFARLAALDRYV